MGSAGGPPAPFGVSPNGIPNGLNGSPGGVAGRAGQQPAFPQRFFRAVMLEHLYDGLDLSLESIGLGGTSPYQAHVTVTGAQPGHTLILQSSPDLRHWTSIATNTPAAITNWPYLDTNAPAIDRRFYRAVGQGK